MDDTTDWSSFRFPPAPPKRWRASSRSEGDPIHVQTSSVPSESFQTSQTSQNPVSKNPKNALPDMYVFEAEHDMGPSFESMAPVWAAPPQLILGWRLQQSGRFWTIIHPSGNKKIDLLRVRSRRRLVALTEVATRQKSHVDVSTLLLALEHAVQRAFNMSLPHMLAWGLMDWEWPALDSDSGFEDDGEHEYELEYETDKDKDKDKDKESEESEGSSDSSGKSEHGDRRIAIPPAHAQENSSKNPTVVSETISLGAPKI